jgi:hypothetical protein
MLRELGFSELQEAAYRALLADPSRDTGTLASLAGTDEQSVRSALVALAEMGAVYRDPGVPAGYSAGNPAVAIGELIERLEDDALRRQRKIGAMRTELPALLALSQGAPPGHQAATRPETGLEVVTSLTGVREKLAELSFYTRGSVWSIQPAGPSTPASRAAAVPLDQRGLRRGLDMRIIYDAAVLGSERGHASLRYRESAGVRIRVRPGPLQRLIIMDERVAVVSASPGSSQGAVIVTQAGLLHSLCELFLQAWENAQELPSPVGSEPELSEDDKVVLALLASGATDEIAARQADVSVRHFRRRVARLMERLAADSRFQAGVAAARRGWL